MIYNKVYAQIGEERHIVLDPINYQYDVKQILVISGETVPEYYEADICNVGDTATLTMIGTAADGVEIPDKFLLDGRNVLVYVVIPGSGGDVQTRYDITIPVDERAEREDIDPSEAEQQQIDSLIAALNSGVGRAEAAVTHYPKIVDGYWYVWNSETETWVNTGIRAEGQNGYSPEVTITEIEGGHRVTITDEDHPQGQTFAVMDGQGGSTGDYDELTNRPRINGHTLSGNQSASDLGLGTYSKPASGIPKADLASDVQASLGKADSALQTAPVQSVAGKTGAVNLGAGDVGFNSSEEYNEGTVGAKLSALNRQLSDVEENQIPELKSALNFTNQGALDYALNYDIDLFKFLKWTKGQYVDNSNGNIINNSRFYISDPIEVSDLKSDYLHLVITNSFTFKCAQYDANGDFLLGSGSSYGSAVDCVLSIQDTCKTIRFSVGAWSGTYTLSDYLNAITIYVKPAHNVVIEDYIGYKELDFLYDNYIVTPSVSTTNVSTTPVSFDQCVCLSTPCTKGQIFTITGTPRDNSGSRPVMFLDQANMCIYRSAETSAFNNVEITAPVTGTLVVNFLKAYPFQCYTGFKNLSEKIFKNLDSVNTIKSFPVDIIPDWLTNAMAIRTVGPLQKGYICLTCDDGATELESYTIPMLLNKQVPCTFGLWASTSKVGAAHPFNKSPVLQTPSGIAAVKNAITAGCSVAQHGPHEWTDMTNEFLNEFFDREAAAWEALEIDVKGAICPSHCINNAVRVTAGGRFGVVRSGYRGYLSKADQQAVINGDVYAEYNYYCAGPRSNVFGLSSFNTNAVTLSWMKGAVDYAIAQKMILVAYWHDWDLTAEQKSDLEAFIDYAKAKNITFCTLGEIPFLA